MTGAVSPLRQVGNRGPGPWRTSVGRHPVLCFVALACALSWAWCLPLALRGATVRAGDGWPTDLPALFSPALAAVVVTAVVDGRDGLRALWSRTVRWRVRWTWWALVGGTLALALLGLLVPLVSGGDVPTLTDFTTYTGIAQVAPLAMVSLVFLSGLGEEIGWRGFAADRLLGDHSLTWVSVTVGAGWAAWHLPLFWLVDSFRAMGLMAVGWLVGLIAGSIVLTYLYREAGRSVVLVAAWHAAFNLVSGTRATGAVVGTVASVLVIAGAVRIVRVTPPA